MLDYVVESSLRWAEVVNAEYGINSYSDNLYTDSRHLSVQYPISAWQDNGIGLKYKLIQNAKENNYEKSQFIQLFRFCFLRQL